jgi:hypothetical protein
MNNDSASQQDKVIIRDTTVHFLWLDSAQYVVINEDYCNVIPDVARAALGYVSYNICSECRWDGEYTDDRGNLKCKIQAALNLGYQCSDKQRGFLRSWFRNDTAVIKELEFCGTEPWGATIGTGFNDIKLAIKSDTLTVLYKYYAYNSREGYLVNLEKEDIFIFGKDYISLVKSNELKREEEKLSMPDE